MSLLGARKNTTTHPRDRAKGEQKRTSEPKEYFFCGREKKKGEKIVGERINKGAVGLPKPQKEANQGSDTTGSQSRAGIEEEKSERKTGTGKRR